MNSKIPVAYKRGQQDFYGRNFIVSSDVLIPRPETEAVIDEVMLLAGKPYLSGMKVPERKLSANPLILDVGTGSGCIAVTIKLELPEVKVVGLDISAKALRIARNNADKFHAEVDFVNSDLLGNYHGQEPDVIVANLPYVDENWEWLDKDTLSHEPSLALYADDRGLGLIKKLLVQIEERGWHPRIILEADPCQHERIIEFAQKHGLKRTKTNGYILVF
ncbi:peptide chain release factor N(5)-glutamine methyltransferase [Candidatus Saccharibacteria bacterium]|nr:peptide chain release factor N(5)-glutamine methyltransferase [Candidatus Saccharibacteria bacterium]